MEKKDNTFIFLSRADVESLNIDYLAVTKCVETSFRLRGLKKTDMPPKWGISTRPSGFMHAMPAYLGGELEAAGMKWVTVYPTNLEKKLPTCQGIILLSDPEDGRPLAIMDGSWVTEKRTAGAGIVALALLRPKVMESVALIGLGKVGMQHYFGIRQIFPEVKKFFVYDLFPAQAERLIAMANTLPGGSGEIISCKDVESAVRMADAIVTTIPMTAEKNPVVKREWLKPECTCIAQDYDAALEPDIVNFADEYFVDDMEQYLTTKATGKYFGTFTKEPKADVGNLVAGSATADPGSKRRVAVLQGIAAHDIATGHYIYLKAREQGLGIKLSL